LVTVQRNTECRYPKKTKEHFKIIVHINIHPCIDIDVETSLNYVYIKALKRAVLIVLNDFQFTIFKF